MPVDSRSIIEAISVLANDRNIRMTVRQSGKGAAVCGACSFVGGLILGPVGLAIGGAAGSLMAYNMTKGSFRPLGDIITNDLTDRQKKDLIEHVTKAVRCVEPTDLLMLLSLITNNGAIQKTVLDAVVRFVSKELGLQALTC